MLGADRSAHEYRDIGEPLALIVGQDIAAEQFADTTPDRTVENVTESAARTGVLRHEEDALEKGRFLQAGISQNEAAFERILDGTLGWHGKRVGVFHRQSKLRQNLRVGNR
jgi:hypothetical protein